MIEDAERLRLPLIELRKVVPFVAVTEAINGRLVNESVRRLQAVPAGKRTRLAHLTCEFRGIFVGRAQRHME